MYVSRTAFESKRSGDSAGFVRFATIAVKFATCPCNVATWLCSEVTEANKSCTLTLFIRPDETTTLPLNDAEPVTVRLPLTVARPLLILTSRSGVDELGLKTLNPRP